jgi:hypothetical protein
MKHKLLLLFLLLFSYGFSQEIEKKSVQEPKSISVQIYPNPVKDSFSLEADTPILWVKIYNVFGKQVAQFSVQERYDISFLKKGMYLLRLETQNGVVVRKLAVE